MAFTRKRQANFTESELKVLVDGVAKYRKVLLTNLCDAVTNAEKTRAWGDVTARVNAEAYCNRSLDSVRKKWEDVKWRTKKRATLAKEIDEREGRFSHPPRGITEFEMKILRVAGDAPWLNETDDILSSTDFNFPAILQPISPGTASTSDNEPLNVNGIGQFKIEVESEGEELETCDITEQTRPKYNQEEDHQEQQQDHQQQNQLSGCGIETLRGRQLFPEILRGRQSDVGAHRDRHADVEMAQFAAEKRKMIIQKARLELERERLKVEKGRLEVEAGWEEVEKRRQEVEKRRQEVERTRLEIDKGRLELEREKIKVDKAWLEVEMGRIEVEKARKEVEKQRRTLKEERVNDLE